MAEQLKNDYSREEIEKYLSDWDNLADTGWFNNPNNDISDYTFHHKNYSNLRDFLSKGREIIRQRLVDKKNPN